MAIDSRAIQNTLRQTLQDVRPVSNLLTGIQTGQDLVQNQQNLLRGDLQNQALQAQVAQQAELAPLEQQVRGGQLQQMLDALGAPDVPTAKEIALNVSKLSFLPPDQVRGQISRMKANAQIAGRTTDNLDELEAAYAISDEAGAQLLNAGVQSLTQAGFLDAPGGALTAGEQEFESNISGFSEEDKTKARRVRAGLDPRAVGSAIQTISDKDIAEKIGDTEATIAERKKFGELTGSSRSKAIDKGFESIQKINTNIKNIDKAIAEIDAGASTGVIESRFFPSFKAATVKLEQIQRELGLDIIGSVSFGALSEGELELALQTALPTGLEPQELKAFLIDKKAAQSKLRSYYSDQMNFLDNGGSIAGFLRQKENKAETSAAQQAAAQPEQATQNTFTSSSGIQFTVE